MLVYRGGQGIDIDRVVVIGRHGSERRLPAHLEQGLEGLVVDGGGGGCGILRIERENENPLASGLLQRLDARRDRGLAIAHGPVDDDLRLAAKGLGHQCRLVARVGPEPAFVQVLVPDELVGLADLARPGVEHDAVEDRIPEETRPFDHAPVAQELPEIAAHGGHVGAVRRAEIYQEHAQLP